MTVLSAALSLWISSCAPDLQRIPVRDPVALMASVIEQESSWRPYAIHDDTTGRRSYDSTPAAALVRARALLAEHHVIDVGYAGIDSVHYSDPTRDLEPCANVNDGARILANDIARFASYETPPEALIDGLRAYNGSGPSTKVYAREVLIRALATRSTLSPEPLVALALPDHPWPANAGVLPIVAQPANRRPLTTTSRQSLHLPSITISPRSYLAWKRLHPHLSLHRFLLGLLGRPTH